MNFLRFHEKQGFVLYIFTNTFRKNPHKSRFSEQITSAEAQNTAYTIRSQITLLSATGSSIGMPSMSSAC